MRSRRLTGAGILHKLLVLVSDVRLVKTLARADSLLKRNSLAQTRLQGIVVTPDLHCVAWVLGTPSEDPGKIVLLKKSF